MVAPDRAVGVPDDHKRSRRLSRLGCVFSTLRIRTRCRRSPTGDTASLPFLVRKEEELISHLFRQAGLAPFGTFTAGVRQTLLRDGFAVIALGEGLQKAA